MELRNSIKSLYVLRCSEFPPDDEILEAASKWRVVEMSYLTHTAPASSPAAEERGERRNRCRRAEEAAGDRPSSAPQHHASSSKLSLWFSYSQEDPIVSYARFDPKQRPALIRNNRLMAERRRTRRRRRGRRQRGVSLAVLLQSPSMAWLQRSGTDTIDDTKYNEHRCLSHYLLPPPLPPPPTPRPSPDSTIRFHRSRLERLRLFHI